MQAPAGKKRPYRLMVQKHVGTKTDAEIAELREKYKNGVPPEMVDFIAGRLADALIEEGKCAEILGED